MCALYIFDSMQYHHICRFMCLPTSAFKILKIEFSYMCACTHSPFTHMHIHTYECSHTCTHIFKHMHECTHTNTHGWTSVRCEHYEGTYKLALRHHFYAHGETKSHSSQVWTVSAILHELGHPGGAPQIFCALIVTPKTQEL